MPIQSDAILFLTTFSKQVTQPFGGVQMIAAEVITNKARDEGEDVGWITTKTSTMHEWMNLLAVQNIWQRSYTTTSSRCLIDVSPFHIWHISSLYITHQNEVIWNFGFSVKSFIKYLHDVQEERLKPFCISSKEWFLKGEDDFFFTLH